MISRLRGEVIERTANRLVVDVGGVGYLVHVSIQSPFRGGQKVDVHIYTHVREDTLQLFGFATPTERMVFDALIGVPNVGPVKAMNILATPVDEIIECVAKRDAKRLAKLPGVGKRTSERILVDLADKFGDLGHHSQLSLGDTPKSAGEPRVVDDLVSALTNLGFKEALATKAAKEAIKRMGEKASLEELLKDILAKLTK